MLLAGCKTELRHGLSERSANEILVVLNEAGIDCTKEPDEGGKQGQRVWKIVVAKKDSPRAVRILEAHNLPREHERGFADVFTKSGLIPTGTEERAMMLQALQGELAHTLKAIDGVVEARVHLVLPKNKEFKSPDEEDVLPSASVLIRYHPDSQGQRPFKDDDIRRLISNSVEGLEASRVEVIATRAQSVDQAGKQPVEFYEFGPLRMTMDSRGPFRIMLIGSIVLMLIPWGVAAYLGTRLIGMNRSAPPPPPQEGEGA